MSTYSFSNEKLDISNESFYCKYQDSNSTGLLYSQISSSIQFVSLLLITAIGLAGNLYVCAVIHKNKNLRNPTFIFMVNLSVANIGALLLCTPFPLAVSWQNKFELGKFWCCASGFLNNLFFCVSIFTFSLITMHKYFSIIRPMVPRCFYMNQNKSKVSIVVLWLVCGGFSLLAMGPFNDWNYIAFNASTAHCGIAFPKTIGDKIRLSALAILAFVGPLILMAYAYCKIYTKVTSHARRVSRTLTTQNHVSPVRRKLTITLCLMFTTFTVCWLPFFLLIALAVAFKNSKRMPYSLGRIAYWFGYFNCAVNPAIYCLRMSAFKETGFRRSSTYNVTRDKGSTSANQYAFPLPNLSFTDISNSIYRQSEIRPSLSTFQSNNDVNKVLHLRNSSPACISNLYAIRKTFSYKTDYRLSLASRHNDSAASCTSTLKTNKKRCSHQPSLETVQEIYTNA